THEAASSEDTSAIKLHTRSGTQYSMAFTHGSSSVAASKPQHHGQVEAATVLSSIGPSSSRLRHKKPFVTKASPSPMRLRSASTAKTSTSSKATAKPGRRRGR
ncbi:hypothetical protein OC834_005263, partial [Tilletia horrida]